MKIKIIIASIFLLSFISKIKAVEGMWLPQLLKSLNEAEMKSMGMKITAEDIYSINAGSLKDAIVHFGGGCTAEMVSKEGLMFTNHHCGYGQIQRHSSLQNDYLKNGFWAMNRSEELTNPGLTATFIISIKDVTNEVYVGMLEGMTDEQKDSVYTANVKRLVAQETKDTHYDGFVRPFYYGNEHFLFVTETFKDVRLVGAPPTAIGKFGSDTDNWMWPRHTGDFAVFRIYAGKDNKPADINKDNVPFVPRRSLKISLKGVNKGDFTMVYGFPGRTQEYLPSHAIDYTLNYTNPARIKVRDARLDIIEKHMLKSDMVRIQYSAKYASVANAWKKWIGENKGLKENKVIDKKRQLEVEFLQKVNADSKKYAPYKNIFLEYDKLYADLKNVQAIFDYSQEAALGIELIRSAGKYNKLIEWAEKSNQEEFNKELEKLKKNNDAAYKDFDFETDKEVAQSLLKMFHENVPVKDQPELLLKLIKGSKNDINKLVEKLYSSSFMGNKDKNKAMLEKLNIKSISKIKKDPIFELYKAFIENYKAKAEKPINEIFAKIESLNALYMKAQKELITDRKYYPDANSTLRVAYGQVNGYEPNDGTIFKHFTTLEGVMQKEDSTNYEFVVPKKLKDLYNKKDYGRYGRNDTLFVCFVASNHTTGGNSGSPVLDAEGNLIGLNFDRVWEGTMSDLNYDKDICRNVTLDVRYALFIIDKYAGAKHLIDEMELVQ